MTRFWKVNVRAKTCSIPSMTQEEYLQELLHLIEGLIELEEKRNKDTRSRMDTRAALKVRQREGEPFTPKIYLRLKSL
jgi:hypothetical protein